MTLPPIDAASAEDAAVFATKFMRSEAAIEIWQGADLVLLRKRAALQRKKCLELLVS
ncbi:MAG: hypothetical protein AB7H70_03965 [Rhodospirillaceae bacterium]|nr:hypothetical protein [Rhodospirillaceae bacterium]